MLNVTDTLDLTFDIIWGQPQKKRTENNCILILHSKLKDRHYNLSYTFPFCNSHQMSGLFCSIDNCSRTSTGWSLVFHNIRIHICSYTHLIQSNVQQSMHGQNSSKLNNQFCESIKTKSYKGYNSGLFQVSIPTTCICCAVLQILFVIC